MAIILLDGQILNIFVDGNYKCMHNNLQGLLLIKASLSLTYWHMLVQTLVVIDATRYKNLQNSIKGILFYYQCAV